MSCTMSAPPVGSRAAGAPVWGASAAASSATVRDPADHRARCSRNSFGLAPAPWTGHVISHESAKRQRWAKQTFQGRSVFVWHDLISMQ